MTAAILGPEPCLQAVKQLPVTFARNVAATARVWSRGPACRLSSSCWNLARSAACSARLLRAASSAEGAERSASMRSRSSRASCGPERRPQSTAASACGSASAQALASMSPSASSSETRVERRMRIRASMNHWISVGTAPSTLPTLPSAAPYRCLPPAMRHHAVWTLQCARCWCVCMQRLCALPTSEGRGLVGELLRNISWALHGHAAAPAPGAGRAPRSLGFILRFKLHSTQSVLRAPNAAHGEKAAPAPGAGCAPRSPRCARQTRRPAPRPPPQRPGRRRPGSSGTRAPRARRTRSPGAGARRSPPRARPPAARAAPQAQSVK